MLDVRQVFAVAVLALGGFANADAAPYRFEMTAGGYFVGMPEQRETFTLSFALDFEQASISSRSEFCPGAGQSAYSNIGVRNGTSDVRMAIGGTLVASSDSLTSYISYSGPFNAGCSLNFAPFLSVSVDLPSGVSLSSTDIVTATRFEPSTTQSPVEAIVHSINTIGDCCGLQGTLALTDGRQFRLLGRSPTLSVVPEPGTLALFGLGLLGLAAVARRRASDRHPGTAVSR